MVCCWELGHGSVHGGVRGQLWSGPTFRLSVDFRDQEGTEAGLYTAALLTDHLSAPQVNFWPLTMGLYVFDRNIPSMRGAGSICLFLFTFLGRSCCIGQTGLELRLSPPQPPEGWIAGVCCHACDSSGNVGYCHRR